MAFSGIRGMPMYMDTRAEKHSGKAALSRSCSSWMSPVKHREANGIGGISNEDGCKPVLASPVQQWWQSMWSLSSHSLRAMAALAMAIRAAVEAVVTVMGQADTITFTTWLRMLDKGELASSRCPLTCKAPQQSLFLRLCCAQPLPTSEERLPMPLLCL